MSEPRTTHAESEPEPTGSPTEPTNAAAHVADPTAPAAPTLLEQMGGISGLIASVIPVVLFVSVSALTEWQVALWAAIGGAVLIAIWRLVRKEALQPAVSGVLGVLLCAFIAYRTGSERGFYLYGIWASLVFGIAFLVSMVVRWPLVGVIWAGLNGSGFAWRSVPRARMAYQLATALWMVFFFSRFVVQQWLYDADEAGWLGVARLSMGTPLTAVALLLTIWAVRRANRIVEEESARASVDPPKEVGAEGTADVRPPSAADQAGDATEAVVEPEAAPDHRPPGSR
ncbi:DUF3159 domain-containing protein [Actinoalloteichus spitiensis]|uniref:DUF3159 domain-containing protein n=1 Tax=Actinoalloteichus spitiensis TaxID=252394 RepID=UPI000361FE30|nr:DUF3159 domain-containing protein [Actinoalloteichus spitiensis]